MSDAYWLGYLAAERGTVRECRNFWSAQWIVDWLRGYDDAQDIRTRLFRCNRCKRPMRGTTAYDGACACGGLIESSR